MICTKELAEYCGEDGGERAATTLLETLAEFTKTIEDAVKKYDHQKEQEAKKEARRKKISESESKTKESLDTPRRELFKTIAGINVQDSTESKIDNIQSSKKNIQVTEIVRNQCLNNNENDDLNESKLQAAIKKQANATLERVDSRKTVLQNIVRRKIDDKENAAENIVLFADSNGNSRPINKQEVLAEPISDPRSSLLQSIVQRRVEKDTSGEVDRPFPIDSSNQLLNSILQRKMAKEHDDKQPDSESKKAKIHLPDEDNEVSCDDRKISQLRSSRSLGCGIVPDWNVAVPTFDPS